MRIKKTMSLILVTCLLITLVPSAFANESATATSTSDDGIIVRIQGIVQKFDQDPIITNGRTMVPLRGIFEKLGAEVLWNGEEQKVTATKGDTTVELIIGSAEATVNGESQTLDSPAVVINSRTMVPARFVSESLGAIVEWDEPRNTVHIYDISQELYEVLKKFDSKFDKNTFFWTASLYDKETGGFYYSGSARDNDGFEADIESTSQMTSLWEMARVIPAGNPPDDIMPLEIKNGMIKFMQERQDPEDGYFYDKQFGKTVGESKKTRNLGQGISVLKRFDSKPLYPTAIDRISSGNTEEVSASLPAYLQSEETLLEWLNALPWGTNNYSAGNSVSSSSTLIRAAGLIHVAQKFVMEKQNTETGLWGDDVSFDELNGAMKLVGLFDQNTPYPNIDKMLESVIHVVTHEEATTTAMLWNPLTLIRQAKATYGGFTEELKAVLDASLVEVLNLTADKLDDFRQPDHGYSWSTMGSSVTSQGARVSLGLAEGDVNGTVLAFMCRRDAYQLAGGILAPPIWDIYRDEYWDRCLNPENYSYDIAEGTEKGFFHDFESGEVGKLPSGWKRTVGEITVQNDPYNPNNKVLEIKTVPGEATKTSASFSGGRDFDKLTLEFKMMVYEASSGAFFYNDVGQAIQWCIVGSSNFAKITNRQSASGTGEDCALLDLETWHDVKIVYEPNGKAASRIQFYVDGYLEKESGRYYGIDSGAAIPTSIDSIVFTSFLAGEGTIYLDDVRVTVE